MKTLDEIIESLEAQLVGTRKLLAEIQAARQNRNQAAKPAVISEDTQPQPL